MRRRSCCTASSRATRRCLNEPSTGLEEVPEWRVHSLLFKANAMNAGVGDSDEIRR